MTASASADRKSMIAKVHIAKSQLGLEDDDYRAVLVRVTGKRSAADCSLGELDAVLKDLRARGFKPVRASDTPHVRKIYALWRDLADKGVIENGSREALAAWVRRMTKKPERPEGIGSPEWLTAAAARPLIEALKRWGDR